MVWEWISAALKALGSVLLRPKNQKPLKDQSFRQINILSKTQNVFFVLNPRTEEVLIGDYGKLPKEVLKLILKQLDPQGTPEGERPEIGLFRNDFYDEALEFQSHIEEEGDLLRTITRHIDPTYASIFRLGSFAKRFYDQDQRRRGDLIKQQVGHQYGRDGRKLANLYTKSYILDMANHYLGSIISSASDKREIGVRLNALIRRMIRSSEYIFFIHRDSSVQEVAAKARKGVLAGVPYIALHSAGVSNIERTTKIIKTIDVEFLEERGFNIKQETPPSTASIPFFDVYITPRPRPAQD